MKNIKGVSETAIYPLWARALETKEKDPIIKDYKSLEILENIDYDFSWLNKSSLKFFWQTVIAGLLLEKHEINENKTVIPRIKYGAGSAKPVLECFYRGLVLEVFNRGAGIQ